MSFQVTIVLLMIGIAISGAMMWLERQPPKELSVRKMPTTPLLLVGVIIALAASIHLLSFLGKH